MNEPMTTEVKDWMKRTDAEPLDAHASARRVMARVPAVRQRSRWLPFPVLYRKPNAATTRDASDPTRDASGDTSGPIPALDGRPMTVTGRTLTMLSPAKAIVAGAVISVIWGVVLVAQPFGQPRSTVPGAPIDDERAAPVEFTGTWIEASEWPLGFVAVRKWGISIVPFDAPEGPIDLAFGGPYGAGWAIADQRGGLIFQVEAPPPPWPPGAVVWLRAETDRPELLVSPPDGDANLVPVGMATSSGGHALFVYGINTETGTIMAADLDDGGTPRQLAVLDGRVDPMWGRYDAHAGGEVVAMVDRQFEDCLTVTLLQADDGSAIPSTPTCLPDEPWDFSALSHDGKTLAAVGWPGSLVDPQFKVTVVDVATGAVVERGLIEVEGNLRAFRPVPSPGGWLLRIDTQTDLLLVDLDGVELVRVERSIVRGGEVGGLALAGVYHHPFNLAHEASLGPR
jgi:hypothetical protein